MDLKIFSANRMKDASLGVFEELSLKRGLISDLSSLSKEKHIVLTPKKLTLSVEKAVLEYLNIDGAFDIEVLTMSRLAEKMLKFCGKYLSPLGAVMLMRKVVNTHEKDLIYYKRSSRRGGFSKEIYSALLELRRNRVSLDALYKALDENTIPSAKYKDLCLLYGAFEEQLKQNYNDIESRLAYFADKMSEIEEIRNCNIYLVDFYSFSESEYALIEGFVSFAKSVSVATVIGGGIRSKSTDTASRIIQIANERGINFTQQYISAKIEPPFDLLHEEIFSYKKIAAKLSCVEKITLFIKDDVYSEVKTAAREIKNLIKQGARYMDFAIITQNENFIPVIYDILNRFDIPHFIDTKKSPLHFSAVRYIISALNVISSSFKAEDVLTFVKNPFFDCPYKDKEAFENYVLMFNVDRNAFKKEFVLNNQKDDLKPAEIVRSKLMSALRPFIKNYFLGEDFISALSRFIEVERLNDKIKRNIALKRASGAHDALKAEEQLFKIISDTVKEMKDLLSNQEQSFDEMKSILISAFDFYDISLIPLYVDSVYVGDYKDTRLDGRKYIFLTGAISGTYPIDKSEKPILSENDLTLLKYAGINVEPTAITATHIETQQLLDTISEAEKLYISYPKLSLNGEDYSPSEFFGSVKDLFYQNKEINEFPYNNENLDEEKKFVYSAGGLNNAFYEYLGAGADRNGEFYASVRETLKRQGLEDKLARADKRKDADTDIGGADNFFKKISDKTFSVSASQIEAYTDCPRKHFYKYAVKLNVRKEKDVEVYDIGNIIHAFLETYFKAVLDKIDQIEEKEIILIARDALEEVFKREEFLPLNIGIKNKNTLSLIAEECIRVAIYLTKYVQNSEFKPYALEMKFGFSDKSKAVFNVGADKFYLVGKIDRVDTLKNQAFILDYKTGTVKESLKEVYFGQKLQLYLYFWALIEEGKLEPVGAFYVPIRDSFIKNEDDDDMRYAYKGQMLKDLEVFYSIDKQAKKTGKGSFLNFELTSTGNFNNRNNNAVSKKQLNDILTYTEKFTEKAIDEILSGEISASPASDCERCDFFSICEKGEKRNFELKNPITAIETAVGDDDE